MSTMRERSELKAPFVYMGGKRRVSAEVWRRFGDVPNYVEPFCGSCAVLLGRPTPPRIETVNDRSAELTNCLRSIKLDARHTAWFAADPVIECDLHAKGDAIFYKRKLVVEYCRICGHTPHCPFRDSCPQTRDDFVAACDRRPAFHCPIAGAWWCWGQSSWIGDAWSAKASNAKHDATGEAVGVTSGLPHLGGAGKGVNRQLPHLGAGKVTTRYLGIRQYFLQLQERFCRVRICTGDWRRVLGETPTVGLGMTGVLLDPPYSTEDRANCYGEHDSRTVALDVLEWCKANGGNQLLRIALCGYAGEHDALVEMGWSVYEWKAQGGHGNQRRDGTTNENSKRERIWFSPACSGGTKHETLFDVLTVRE